MTEPDLTRLRVGSPEVVRDLVSTIIPAYNRAELLRRAVESVVQQSWRPIEIVISDDGSTDATPAVVEALKQEHPNLIRYVRNPNRGPGPAREAGRQLARGEFIQYLDSDDVLLPKKFELQVGTLRRRPDCGIAYGWTKSVPNSGDAATSPTKWTGREIEYLFPGLLVDRWWCTVSPLYRRSVTDRIGAWSDLRYSQDWEYDARAGALGVRLAYVPEFLAEQHQHPGFRQTGSGRWLAPEDRVRFFTIMARCARDAGCFDPTLPEVQHFVRWIFTHARACAELREPKAAEALVELAIDQDTGAIDLALYRRMARLLGWRLLAIAARYWDYWRAGSTGTRSLKQSWMVDD